VLELGKTWVNDFFYLPLLKNTGYLLCVFIYQFKRVDATPSRRRTGTATFVLAHVSCHSLITFNYLAEVTLKRVADSLLQVNSYRV
jgi:hypothetical protein